MFILRLKLKISITPYGENFYKLTYWDKIWNLEGYSLRSFFPPKNYEMDVWLSGNNGKIVCKALRIQVL